MYRMLNGLIGVAYWISEPCTVSLQFVDQEYPDRVLTTKAHAEITLPAMWNRL